MKHDSNSFYQLSCQDRNFDDYLLLGGGTDINPNIYGEEASPYTQYPNKARDTANIKAIQQAVKEGKPIFGICRGLQLLDAVFGGKLIQHTVGHSSRARVFLNDDDEPPFGHPNVDPFYDGCSSCHHQVVDLKHTKGKMLGFSSYQFRAYFGDNVEVRGIVPQILYWPDKKALAVQFHPEWHEHDHAMNRYLRGLIKETLGLENVL